MTSSIYAQSVTPNDTPITADTDILSSDISISASQVSPGGGGILRLMFSFVFASSPAVVRVFNNSVLKGSFNADNSFEIVDDGYYRFDIDVESGDEINLQASSNVTTVNFIRAHLIQFGA